MSQWLKRILASSLLVLMAAWPALASADELDLVPIRFLAEAADARVDWDGETRVVTVTTADGVTATLRIGDTAALVDGESVKLAEPIRLVEGRTMVPREFVNGLIGLPVEYSPAAQYTSVDPQYRTARSLARLLPAGQAAELRPSFSPALQAAYSAEALAAFRQAFIPYGEAGRPVVTGSFNDGVHRNVKVLLPFSHLTMEMLVRFDAQGQINDWRLDPYAPTQTAGSPAYADPAAYIEEIVVIGEEPWQLPGTLTLPVGDGPFPVVVLVHGSGPNDRDTTVGGAKPFRDLAEGLATQGIATLRYDKRTLIHSAKFAVKPVFTVQEETVEDALVAVQHLRGDERIDSDRIYVLGHSLGGIALPRILAQDEAHLIRGGISMAASNSFLDALWAQNQYVVESGEVPPQQLPFIAGQIAMLRDPGFDPDQPPAGFALGMPHYWHDLVPKAADQLKELTQPILFLQGERDFQVPASELESFKADLADRTNLTYQLFPKLNHIFTEGEGKIGSLQEYLVPANLPEYVMQAIADWISTN